MGKCQFSDRPYSAAKLAVPTSNVNRQGAGNTETVSKDEGTDIDRSAEQYANARSRRIEMMQPGSKIKSKRCQQRE
jgi:hypothetical protein